MTDKMPETIWVSKGLAGPHIAKKGNSKFPQTQYVRKNTASEKCEACERTGRLYCLPDDGKHTHPCDTCQPEALKEFNRGVAVVSDIADLLAAALEGVLRIADRKTVEFDAARAALEAHRGQK